jgi:hypothetical protein
MSAMHERDEDCAGHIDADEQCTVCGVSHTYECEFCGGRGFHRSEYCPDLYDCGTPEHAAALATWRGVQP